MSGKRETDQSATSARTIQAGIGAYFHESPDDPDYLSVKVALCPVPQYSSCHPARCFPNKVLFSTYSGAASSIPTPSTNSACFQPAPARKWTCAALRQDPACESVQCRPVWHIVYRYYHVVVRGDCLAFARVRMCKRTLSWRCFETHLSKYTEIDLHTGRLHCSCQWTESSWIRSCWARRTRARYSRNSCHARLQKEPDRWQQ